MQTVMIYYRKDRKPQASHIRINFGVFGPDLPQKHLIIRQIIRPLTDPMHCFHSPIRGRIAFGRPIAVTSRYLE